MELLALQPTLLLYLGLGLVKWMQSVEGLLCALPAAGGAAPGEAVRLTA